MPPRPYLAPGLFLSLALALILAASGRSQGQTAPSSGTASVVTHGAGASAQLDEWGDTPLHLAKTVDEARRLLDQGADVNARRLDGFTPLHFAYQLDMARLLLDRGADINAKTKNGQTPLSMRLYGRKYDGGRIPNWSYREVGPSAPVAKLLLERGVELTSVTATALNTLRGYLEEPDFRALLLKKGVDTNSRDWQGRTAVFGQTSPVVLRFLKEAGADLAARDNSGMTALFMKLPPDPEYTLSLDPGEPSEEVPPEVLDILIEGGCRVTDRALDGETPLHRQSAWGTDACVRRLVERGADVRTTDTLGRTPLHFSLRRVLLEKGADINARDIHGQTPVHYYACYAEPWYIRSGTESPNLVGFLRDFPQMKADVNARDFAGRTPLHWLAFRTDEDARYPEKISSHLVALGADLNPRDMFGRTPQDCSGMLGNRLMVQSLGNAGATGGTTVTAPALVGGDYLNPVGFMRGFTERHGESGRDRRFEDLHYLVQLRDLNNDGLPDLLITNEALADREGEDWAAFLGTPEGRFRPATITNDEKSDEYPLHGGHVFGEAPLSVGKAIFHMNYGRNYWSTQCWYRCDHDVVELLRSRYEWLQE